MVDLQDLPPRPKLRHDKLEELVDQLAGRLADYHARQLDVHFARQLGKSLATILGHKVPENNVQNTLTQYAGEQLNDKLIERLSWQLAARVDALRAGPLLRVATPRGVGWHVVEIYQLVPDVQKDRQGYQVTLFCRFGPLAGYRLVQWFSTGYLSYLAYQVLGFSRRLVMEPDEPTWLLGLRAWTFMVDREDKLELQTWDNDSNSRKRNQEMLKLRMRFVIDLDRVPDEREHEYSCTRKFDHYCSACPVLPAECNASIHRDPLILAATAHNQS